MYAEQTMQAFLEELSSDAPVPGGGGACAYAAAMGICLGSMVANLTVGKKKYAEYEEENRQMLERCKSLSDELVACMTKDAEAFEPLSKAYGLPKTTPEEQELRDKLMEDALVKASEAPLHLMGVIMESIEILARLARTGSRIALSDVGVGVSFARAAMNGASLNVFINTRMMKNRQRAEEMNRKADELLYSANQKADKVFDLVHSELHED